MWPTEALHHIHYPGTWRKREMEGCNEKWEQTVPEVGSGTSGHKVRGKAQDHTFLSFPHANGPQLLAYRALGTIHQNRVGPSPWHPGTSRVAPHPCNALWGELQGVWRGGGWSSGGEGNGGGRGGGEASSSRTESLPLGSRQEAQVEPQFGPPCPHLRNEGHRDTWATGWSQG